MLGANGKTNLDEGVVVVQLERVCVTKRSPLLLFDRDCVGPASGTRFDPVCSDIFEGASR